MHTVHWYATSHFSFVSPVVEASLVTPLAEPMSPDQSVSPLAAMPGFCGAEETRRIESYGTERMLPHIADPTRNESAPLHFLGIDALRVVGVGIRYQHPAVALLVVHRASTRPWSVPSLTPTYQHHTSAFLPRVPADRFPIFDSPRSQLQPQAFGTVHVSQLTNRARAQSDEVLFFQRCQKDKF